MENVFTLLKLAVATIITVVLITYALSISGIGENLFRSGTKDLDNTIENASQFVLKQYQGDHLPTSLLYDLVDNYSDSIEVRVQTYAMQLAGDNGNVCKSFRDKSKNDGSDIFLSHELQEYYVYPNSYRDIISSTDRTDSLHTASSSTTITTGGSHSLTVRQFNDMQKSDSPLYVNPDATWSTKVVREGEVITAILFKQDKPDVVDESLSTEEEPSSDSTVIDVEGV